MKENKNVSRSRSHLGSDSIACKSSELNWLHFTWLYLIPAGIQYYQKDFLFHWHCLWLISSIANSRRVFHFVLYVILLLGILWIFRELNWISLLSVLLCLSHWIVSHADRSVWEKKLCFRASNANNNNNKKTIAWQFNSSRIKKVSFENGCISRTVGWICFYYVYV